MEPVPFRLCIETVGCPVGQHTAPFLSAIMTTSLDTTAWAIPFNVPLPYDDGVRLQNALLTTRIAGDIPDTVLFLEHPPVITKGVRSKDEHILLSADDLKHQGIQLTESTRGGDVTWHGPGQLVIYPLLKLGENEADAHGYLWNLEATAIATAADYGVEAYRRQGKTGAWTQAGKIAAIGIRLKRWVTHHGMSFNVDPDLSGFAKIIPCGLVGEPVASLKILLGDAHPTVADVRPCLARHFETIFRRRLTWLETLNAAPPTLRSILEPYQAYF